MKFFSYVLKFLGLVVIQGGGGNTKQVLYNAMFGKILAKQHEFWTDQPTLTNES